MISYIKKLNLVCFDIQDIRSIFEAPSREGLMNYVLKETEFLYGEYPYFLRDSKKMQEITDNYSLVNGKEDVEIFTASYIMIKFFPENSRVGFYMKDGFDPNYDSINSLDSLRKNIKESHLADVCLLTGNDLRAFQLKSYKGNCTITEFMSFLTEKLKHYAFDLGSINLVITLGSSGEIEKDFFHNVHDWLSKVEIKGTGEILITYNGNNEFDVLNTVYPKLSGVKVPYRKLSERL
jgi:hypothetical protein